MDKPLLDWNYLRNAFLNKSNKNKTESVGKTDADNKIKPSGKTEKVKETPAIRVRKMFKKSNKNV